MVDGDGDAVALRGADHAVGIEPYARAGHLLGGAREQRPKQPGADEDEREGRGPEADHGNPR